MNHRQINAFRHVMRHGSITAAAQAMSVSQPAVSRLIADLERDIGFDLLVRAGGRSHPTAEAHAFMQEVERMYYGLDRLASVAGEIRDLRRTTFRVASMPMVSFEIIPQAMQSLLKRHSGIAITHDVQSSSRVLDLLTSRQIDLGIAQVHASDRDDMDILASYRTHCVCAMRPDHPLAGRDVLHPTDLRREPLVALTHHTVTWGYMIQRFEEAGVTPHILAESQPSYSACGLAALGVGIAIVDPITPGVFGDKLATVPFEPMIPFDFQIVKPADIPISRISRAFLDDICQVIESDAGFGRSVHKILT